MSAAVGQIVSVSQIGRDVVRTELARRGFRLRFTPALERLFETGIASGRATHLVRSGVLALILPNAFLIADARLIPDAFGLSVLLHVVATLVYGAVLVYTARKPAPFFREMANGICVIAILLGSIAILCSSNAPDRGYLSVTYVLYVVYANVVVRLRFGWCVIFSATGTLAAIAAAMLSHSLPAGVQVLMPLSVLTAAAFTLYANYTIEAGERRGFLLALDQRLCAEELAILNVRLSALSTTDWLTGVANRRGLDLFLEEAWSQALATAQPLAWLMIDVDHFKLFNDEHGHPAGDACLKQLAVLIGQLLRQGTDRLGRYGGEEFAIILPNMDEADASRTAERIRQCVEALGLPHGAPGAGPVVTVSIGACSLQLQPADTPKRLIAGADIALYEGKHRGRNCVHPPPLLARAAAENLAA